MSIRLTEYSHGAGCGCKLSPAVLSEILAGAETKQFEDLIIGNDKKDDAAVYRFDEEFSVISTTDFFMPIVDDPFDFGAIAATNAISDIYAMGGAPLMAIAILGWPIDKLGPDIANRVMEGGRKACHDAAIPLAGGHSIDTPEPIFGLAVTGKIRTSQLKANGGAKPGDLLYLTKPLGIGLVTTAQKQGKVSPEDLKIARESMLKPNAIGAEVSALDYVHAITDVTGFGLAGHLLEILDASDCSATVELEKVPVFPFTRKYLDLATTPGGTKRNWSSYGQNIAVEHGDWRLLADPQTSGGLLVVVDPNDQKEFEGFVKARGYDLNPIGEIEERSQDKTLKII